MCLEWAPSKVGGGLPVQVSGAVLWEQELESSGSVASLQCLRTTASVEGCGAAVPQVWHPGVPHGRSGTTQVWGRVASAFPRCLGPKGDLRVNLCGGTTLGLPFAARLASAFLKESKKYAIPLDSDFDKRSTFDDACVLSSFMRQLRPGLNDQCVQGFGCHTLYTLIMCIMYNLYIYIYGGGAHRLPSTPCPPSPLPCGGVGVWRSARR